MGKVKMRYSVYDKKTKYFTKYRTITVKMAIITNSQGFILFDDTFKRCEEIASKSINIPFRVISFQII